MIDWTRKHPRKCIFLTNVFSKNNFHHEIFSKSKRTLNFKCCKRCTRKHKIQWDHPKWYSKMTMVRFLLPGWNAYFATDVFLGEKAIQCDFISHFSAPPYITTHLLQTSDNGTRETTCESISKRRTQAHYVSNSADDKRRMSNRARIAQLRKADPRQLFPFNSAR